MFWDNEYVIDAMNKESRNICLFDMFSNGIYLFYVKIVLNNCIFTLSFIVDFKNDNAIPLKNEKPPPCFSASYLHNFYKLENGESSTTHPIS